MAKKAEWLTVRTYDPAWLSRVRLVAANMGLTLSDFTRLAIDDKIKRLGHSAKDYQDPHPSVPLGTDGTSPVTCSVCGEQEVRTEWEMSVHGHGKCRGLQRECRKCRTQGLPTKEPTPRVESAS